MEGFEDPNLQSLVENIAKKEGFKQPKYTVNMAVKPGENFVGRVYRVEVREMNDKNKKPISLILKASPINKTRKEGLSTDKLFRTESEMYDTVLPTLNKLLNKHGVWEKSTFPGTPRCFITKLNDDPNEDMAEVLVLEDMKPHGYVMVDAKPGLDAHQCRLILKKLAVLHASSLALRFHDHAKADYLEKLISKNIWFTNPSHPLLDDIQKAIFSGLDMLGEPYKKGNPVYDKLYRMAENFHNEYIRINNPPEDLACINHADCWSNNVLFKYGEDGNLQDVCLIDFQISRVASPALDITYMLFLSTTKETRDAHYDDLIRSYHEEVSKHLTALGCDAEKIMPWDLLQEHLRVHGTMGIISAVFGVPIILADSKKDLHSGQEDTIFCESVKVTDPVTLMKVSERLADIMEDYVRKGYF